MRASGREDEVGFAVLHWDACLRCEHYNHDQGCCTKEEDHNVDLEVNVTSETVHCLYFEAGQEEQGKEAI